jgi:hypothetical protein
MQALLTKRESLKVSQFEDPQQVVAESLEDEAKVLVGGGAALRGGRSRMDDVSRSGWMSVYSNSITAPRRISSAGITGFPLQESPSGTPSHL